MGEELVKESSPKTYSEIFHKAFPMYLALGMTYDEFWHGEACLARHYRQAHVLKLEIADTNNWRLGAYFAEAMSVVLYNGFKDKRKKPIEYSKKPYGLKTKENTEKQIENEKLKLMFNFRQAERAWKKQKGGGLLGE